MEMFPYVVGRSSFMATKTEFAVSESRGLMQTAVEPFMQPGDQEAKENIYLSLS